MIAPSTSTTTRPIKPISIRPRPYTFGIRPPRCLAIGCQRKPAIDAKKPALSF